MDPEANLKDQRRLAERILNGDGSESDAYRLAELVEALDEWIAKGGFLPARWKRQRAEHRSRRSHRAQGRHGDSSETARRRRWLWEHAEARVVDDPAWRRVVDDSGLRRWPRRHDEPSGVLRLQIMGAAPSQIDDYYADVHVAHTRR
jgi:hypothetical protein